MCPGPANLPLASANGVPPLLRRSTPFRSKYGPVMLVLRGESDELDVWRSEIDKLYDPHRMIVADRSASTRCGVDATGASEQGLQIATLIARSIATIGMSAVFFQDSIGLITFDEGFRHLGAVRPRMERLGCGGSCCSTRPGPTSTSRASNRCA